MRIIQNIPYIIPFKSIKGCDDEKCNQTNKEQHDRFIKNVLCNLVLFRKIILVSRKNNADIYYKINQLPNKIGWYLCYGHINLLKERIEREERELILQIINNNTSSSSSSLNSFTIKKDYLFDDHLKWNYKATEYICSFNGQDEQHLELFKYLFEKKPEWFNYEDCFKMAASKGNIEMFKILVNNTVPIKISYDMNECITLAIQGMHPDMALYLLEKINYKLKVTEPFTLNDGLCKHNQSDLIKLARLFVDIVNKNKQYGFTMDKVFRHYFHKLLIPTRDIDTIKYAQCHYESDLSVVEYVYSSLLCTGLPKDIDTDHHIDFIKQVLELISIDFEICDESTTTMVIEEEMDCVEKKKESSDQSNAIYFDSLTQLSTKQSRWYMFIYNMFFYHKVETISGNKELDAPHILKVRVKEEQKVEFVQMVCEKHGWAFIMNYGTLEYVKLAHSLRLVDVNSKFYPKHQDSNQTLAIMQYLHDNNIKPFRDTMVGHCRESDDKVILFLHKHYPQLLHRDQVLDYIKRNGHFYLASAVLALPGPSEIILPQRILPLMCDIKDSTGLNATSLDVLIKLNGYAISYYYDDHFGQESFQLMKQYYNADIHENIKSTYQQQLKISTENNQIHIVEWLLYQQTKYKPSSSTLVNILSQSFNRQYKALYQLIKRYYRDNGKQLDFGLTTWNELASRGDIKTFDKLMTKCTPLREFIQMFISTAIIHNQLAFIKHLYNTQYGTSLEIFAKSISKAIAIDSPMILKYFLDLEHQEEKSQNKSRYEYEFLESNVGALTRSTAKRCLSNGSLSCFKMILDLDYFDLASINLFEELGKSISKNNLSIVNYLVHHGYIVDEDTNNNNNNNNTDQQSDDIPFLKELLLDNKKR
ncbi:hypothetical protein DFA_02371 [Cavenderia fasciculata]|uniref:Ankyrin repeat-containing protein n=1 Tax=Cavenderia fasciculata TaxID=261658 RepID=F4PZ95_CACFS|nr:uncharacterized protein DFA_02371 [Cavenderia fasciculata]EGG19124.1 hypothetical protein DFA_02371 [Cavenderia fasciculata]|eukprot:XP_004366757.1 hypothetical protein DFA_02371 [Cavenderia fasciculata]